MKSKRQTPNAKRRTSNAELGADQQPVSLRFNEGANAAYGSRAKDGEQGAAKYDLEERLLDFASRIVRLVDALPNTRAGNHIGGQLLRCGTSPLANHGEVEAAESRNDFVHKLRICLKELRETGRWLRLLERAGIVSLDKMRPLIVETDELTRIFSSSVRTARKVR